MSALSAWVARRNEYVEKLEELRQRIENLVIPVDQVSAKFKSEYDNFFGFEEEVVQEKCIEICGGHHWAFEDPSDAMYVEEEGGDIENYQVCSRCHVNYDEDGAESPATAAQLLAWDRFIHSYQSVVDRKNANRHADDETVKHMSKRLTSAIADYMATVDNLRKDCAATYGKHTVNNQYDFFFGKHLKVCDVCGMFDMRFQPGVMEAARKPVLQIS